MANAAVRQFRWSFAHTLRRARAESGRKTENVSLRKSGMSSVPDKLFVVGGEFKRRGRRWAGWGRVFLTLTSWISGCSPSPWKPWILLLELLFLVECQPYMYASVSLRALFVIRSKLFMSDREKEVSGTIVTARPLVLPHLMMTACCYGDEGRSFVIAHAGLLDTDAALYSLNIKWGLCLPLIHAFKLLL